MTIKIPKPLAAYFTAANNHDIDAMLASFAEQSIVKDEGQEMRGRTAIREWMEETTRKYGFTVEATDVAVTDGRTLVTGLVSGNFPGSPAQLQFAFTLDGEKIVNLEIH
jgi:ketosteroid isomerase-like protein